MVWDGTALNRISSFDRTCIPVALHDSLNLSLHAVICEFFRKEQHYSQRRNFISSPTMSDVLMDANHGHVEVASNLPK